MNAQRINMAAVRDRLYTPILAPMMQNRWINILLAATSVFLVTVTTFEVPAWQCPLKATLGVTCPGCGLTRAIVLLAQGQWLSAVKLHAFAPLGVAVGVLLVASALVPIKWRAKAAGRLAVFERRSGIGFWLLLSVLIYWICRLIIQM
jgi:hypothetical protein